MAKSFYGIDLGTTYSCIATIDSDEIVTVIPHALTGELTVPSAVSFDDDGSILVGRAAKNQLVTNRKTRLYSSNVRCPTRTMFAASKVRTTRR